MMTEKEIVTNAINNINSTLSFYTSAISQTENVELRSTLIQLRNQAEKSQYDLYRVAKKFHYDIPVTQEESRNHPSESDSHSRSNPAHLNQNSAENYLSSQSNGILKHIDFHTNHALQASSGSVPDSIRK